MSIQSQNAATGFFDSYVADAAVSLMFGVGYFLFQKFKSNKKEKIKALHEDPETSINFLKEKFPETTDKWKKAKTVEEYNELIKSFYDGVDDPFEIISNMNRRGVLPNIETFNILLQICLVNQNEEGVESLKYEIFDYMGPFKANVTTLNVLIKGLGLKYLNILNRQKLELSEEKLVVFKKFDEELIELIHSMEKKNIYIDVNCQNSILQNLFLLRRFNDAWCQYFNMKKLFSPNEVTYNILIKGFIERSQESDCDSNEYFFHFSKICEIIEEDKSDCETCILHSINFKWLIDSCLRFNNIKKAENFFTQRKQKCLEISEETYEILIKFYGATYDLKKAYDIFEEYKLKKLKISKEFPCLEIYSSLINNCVMCADIPLAENIIEEMTVNRIEKNLTIYKTMMIGYRTAKLYNRAIELYDYLMETKHNQIIYDVEFFNPVLDCCVEANKLNKMIEIHRSISEGEFSFVKINIYTCIILLKGYAIANCFEKVKEIYCFLSTFEDLELDESLYNLILQLYAENGDEENLEQIISDIKKRQIKLNSNSYDALIKYNCNKRNFNKAFELFDESVKCGNKPKGNIYHLLIKLQIESRLIDRAITLFRNMAVNNIKADSVLYNLVIETCYSSYHHKAAAEFTTNATKDRIKLDPSLYEKLISCVKTDNEEFKIAEKYKIIQEFLASLEESKIQVNKAIITELNDFISLYERKYLNQNNQKKRNDYRKFYKDSTAIYDEEISIYDPSYIPMFSNNNHQTYNDAYDFDNFNNYQINTNYKQILAKNYTVKYSYSSEFEEEKSIYS
jgi:pentatricopeptide repeat protein